MDWEGSTAPVLPLLPQIQLGGLQFLLLRLCAFPTSAQGAGDADVFYDSFVRMTKILNEQSLSPVASLRPTKFYSGYQLSRTGTLLRTKADTQNTALLALKGVTGLKRFCGFRPKGASEAVKKGSATRTLLLRNDPHRIQRADRLLNASHDSTKSEPRGTLKTNKVSFKV